MGESFFSYIQKLELIGFFSGYSLLYAVVLVISDQWKGKNFKTKFPGLLPLSYALTGTLYLGLQLKNWYYNVSSPNITHHFGQPVLMVWALLSLLFWFPFFQRKKIWPLLHSLVFFFILIRDMIKSTFTTIDENILRNEMKIYTVSLLLNISCFVLICIISLFFLKKKSLG